MPDPIGALAYSLAHANVPEDLDAQVHRALGRVGLQPQQEFTASLKAALEAKAYQVTVVPVQREGPGAWYGDYGTLSLGADAVMDVPAAFVLMTDSVVGSYKPQIFARARLTDLADDRVRFMSKIYTPEPGQEFVMALPVEAGPDGRFTAREMVEDPERLAAAIRFVIKAGAGYLADQLGVA